MKICCNSHPEIAHTQPECPLCALLEQHRAIVERLQEALDESRENVVRMELEQPCTTEDQP